MTQGARLVLCRLVVEGRDAGRAGINRQGMAFEAQQVHLAALEQAHICRAVGHMTTDASLRLHRRVLINEGAGFIRVAFHAHDILGGR